MGGKDKTGRSEAGFSYLVSLLAEEMPVTIFCALQKLREQLIHLYR